MLNKNLLWEEIKKHFGGYQKYLWIFGFLVYISLIIGELYTFNNQTQQYGNSQKIISLIQNTMYSGGSMIGVLIIILQVSVVYCRENASNMFSIIKASRHGGRDILLNKLVSTYLVVIIMTIFLNVIAFSTIIFGFHNVEAIYMNLMFRGAILQFLGYLIITSICLIVSEMVNSIYTGIGISLFIIFMPMFLSGSEKIDFFIRFLPMYYVNIKFFITNYKVNIEAHFLVALVVVNLIFMIGATGFLFRKKGKWMV